MASLDQLLEQYPESEVLQSYKNSFGGAYFYLGGQIKMRTDQEITQRDIDETKAMYVEPWDAANSLEMASIRQHFYKFEEFVKLYSTGASRRVRTSDFTVNSRTL